MGGEAFEEVALFREVKRSSTSRREPSTSRADFRIWETGSLTVEELVWLGVPLEEGRRG